MIRAAPPRPSGSVRRLTLIVYQVYYLSMQTNVVDLIYRAHRLLSRMEQQPRDYGTGRKLFASEIHTLACVAENPHVNLTGLADRLGVTKSAASKFVRKLLASGYIEKTRLEGNAKEVLFRATAEGEKAARGHARFRERTFGRLEAIVAELDPGEEGLVREFLERLYTELEVQADKE